jgi:ketosteroid isomerase-like protein
VSHDNVEIARRVYAATAALKENVASGGDPLDVREYWDLFDPDVVNVEIAELPDATTYRGLDQMRRWLQGWVDIFDEIAIEPQDFVPVGEFVLVPTRQRFRSKTGIDVEQDITQVLQFRDSRVIYATGYRERANGLKAVGLKP